MASTIAAMLVLAVMRMLAVDVGIQDVDAMGNQKSWV